MGRTSLVGGACNNVVRFFFDAAEAPNDGRRFGFFSREGGGGGAGSFFRASPGSVPLLPQIPHWMTSAFLNCAALTGAVGSEQKIPRFDDADLSSGGGGDDDDDTTPVREGRF